MEEGKVIYFFGIRGRRAESEVSFRIIFWAGGVWRLARAMDSFAIA